MQLNCYAQPKRCRGWQALRWYLLVQSWTVIDFAQDAGKPQGMLAEDENPSGKDLISHPSNGGQFKEEDSHKGHHF